MSKAERLLSYSLLSLITSKFMASALITGIRDDEDENNGNEDASGSTQKNRKMGLMNEDGAWCWREDCKGMLLGLFVGEGFFFS